jgi:hypothetical protein
MVTLVTSNVRTGRVRRRHYPTADQARQAVDATLDGWYQRQRHGRQGLGRPPLGLEWDPGARRSRHPYKFELTVEAEGAERKGA